jgi:hypothetical protein
MGRIAPQPIAGKALLAHGNDRLEVPRRERQGRAVLPDRAWLLVSGQS